jgi:hypothetical protein
MAAAPPPGVEGILYWSRAFEVSRAVGVAAKLGLFTALSSSGSPGLTAQEVGQALSLCQAPGFRGTADWLDLLVSIGLLLRQGGWVLRPACMVASAWRVPARQSTWPGAAGPDTHGGPLS